MNTKNDGEPHGAPTEEVDVVDLAEYAQAGRQPPKATKYRIRIDKETFEVAQSAMTGRQILALVGKTPETHLLRERIHEQGTHPIEPDQTVDFTRPGVEQFVTLPRDQRDGGR